jgi:hypothetical protein
VQENLTVASRGGSADDTLAQVGMGWAAEAMPAGLSTGQRKLEPAGTPETAGAAETAEKA